MKTKKIIIIQILKEQPVPQTKTTELVLLYFLGRE